MSELTKIFISGYPLDMDEMGLAQLVSLYGQVETIKIVRDKATKKVKGYAFLEMINRSAAEEAILGLSGKFYGDHELTVNFVPDKPAQPVRHKNKYMGSAPPAKTKRPRLSK